MALASAIFFLLGALFLVWKRRDHPWDMFTAGMLFYMSVIEIGKAIIHWINQ